jgi:hypothetical protein
MKSIQTASANFENACSCDATLPGGKSVSGSDAKLFILAKAKFVIYERSCSEYPSPGVASTWTGTNFHKLLLIEDNFNHTDIFYEARDSIRKYFKFAEKIL